MNIYLCKTFDKGEMIRGKGRGREGEKSTIVQRFEGRRGKGGEKYSRSLKQ